jgi:ABC-type transport system involved in multi-copper enzyme maturation permease subunit
MTPVLRAELGKLRATRMTYGLLAAAFALVVLSAVAIVLSSRTGDGPAALDTVQGTRLIVSTAGAGTLFALILGILTIAGEFQHGTATWTFLATPRRDRVLAAKLAAAVVAGIGYGLACLAVLLAVAVPLLATVDGARQPRLADVGTIGAGVVASYAPFAMFGVAVGAVLRNQVAAIVVMLAWSFVVEPLVLLLVPKVGRWLPGNAADALTNQDAGQLSGYEPLPQWGAGLVLLAYVAVLAALGGWLLARRDIT